jgi:putative FmdB family regulatory protein
MPLYEYTCDRCRKRYSVLVGVTAESDSTECPHCGHDQATKRVTRFAALRGEESLLGDLADPEKMGDPDDPAAMRRWAREVGGTMGEGLGDDFDEYLDGAEDDDDEDSE